MSHVFVRVSGFGMRLMPHWPYEFVRTGASPDSVRVFHADASHVVDRDHAVSADGIVDVSAGPDYAYWLVETSLYSFQWPDGLILGTSGDAADPNPFYLFGEGYTRIFPQGPYPTEVLPDGAGWTAPGQTLVVQRHTDGIDVFELEYVHDGAAWWQTHWTFQVGAGMSLVLTGQSPASDSALIRTAMHLIVDTLGPTRH